jgi:hypothetical protein
MYQPIRDHTANERSSNEPGAPDDSLAELERRIARFVHRIDLAGEVAAKPWQAVGLAVLAGAALGFARRRKAVDTMSIADKLVDAGLSALGVLALRAIRDVAFKQFAEATKRWWSESASTPGQPDVRADKPRTQH